MRTLVIGCDASGKSTFLNLAKEAYGDQLIESTSTPESRAFKRASVEKAIDQEYIDQREALYLKLSRDVLSKAVAAGMDYTSTDATLVTRVSHDVMRRAINLPGKNNDDIIRAWQDDEQEIGASTPDIIAFTHAPFEVIRNRIIDRQQAGQTEEKFWGFNSPFFLQAYQERWHDVISDIGKLGFRCIKMDSSQMTPEDQLTLYADARNDLMLPAVRSADLAPVFISESQPDANRYDFVDTAQVA